MYDEISKQCRVCRHAKGMGDGRFVCDLKGLVQGNYSCKSFELNPSLPRPSRRRTLDPTRYEKDDFSIT